MGLLTEKITGKNNNKPWNAVELNTVTEVFHEITTLQSNTWVSRGQSKYYGEQLFPPIDREKLGKLNRIEKIALESQSLRLFRSNIRFFSEGEQETLVQNIPALMLMQHNGVPTRLLDWSLSPFVSLYFACRNYWGEKNWEDGEIWAFDYSKYEEEASKQWNNFPETQKNTQNGKIFNEEMPAIFSTNEPENLWFVLQFLRGGFSRLSSQNGLFSVVSRFSIDHVGAIKELLGDEKYLKRFVIKKELKKNIREILLRNYGIWEGSLFPDSTGVSEAISRDLYGIANVNQYNEIPDNAVINK